MWDDRYILSDSRKAERRKMIYSDFTMQEHGFVGHMAEPENSAAQAVIVMMGGEKSLLPGIKIAERFADYGICGLAVSLFGAEGLPEGVDLIPLEMFEKAVQYLRNVKGIESISTYGMSMGSLFAVMAAKYIDGIENVILVSPSHVPFEGTIDKKNMSGHSMMTWRGKELPFVKPDFAARKAGKYYFDPGAGRKVTGMWISYRDAYEKKEAEAQADIHIEKLHARILMLAGTGDEAWPSDYSVKYLKKRLDEAGYEKDYEAILYPNASHLLGMMPNKERNKWLYRMLPVAGLMYQSLNRHREDCMRALEDSEQKIVEWILGS